MSTKSQIAFAPLGKTIVVAAAATAPAGIQAPVYAKFDGLNAGLYRIINAGTSIVFLGTGASAAKATANAVEPIAGTPSAAIVLLAGAVATLRFSQDTYFSGRTTGNGTVYITPGQGL
jgi:hypothetical protein